ncbi:hypothetical protein [Mesorhizobium muleiense]|uniref:hypothetical protein n=1 Tax=Mesorhizobium muleiense TaxID=1004279 RepID=UPI001F1D48F1|nr:hypothetical protein [Mesorhizobium muleiense]MCF6111657.1 hypothetical protein [Mesorhizobium muleiense]
MRRTIGQDELDNFEVDGDRLYWKGSAVVMERKLALDWYQTTLATAAAVGALLAGIHPFGVTLGWW